MALSDIEEKIGILRDDQAKLAALREDINSAIERGGSYTDEEVEASIEATLDDWERKRLKLRFAAAAKDDLDSIAEYIAERSGSRGRGTLHA